MGRIVYVNGRFLPEQEAVISVFDRGFLFADGVYEVTAVIDGRLVDYHPHMARLDRSMGELGLSLPVGHEDLLAIHRRLIADNRLEEGGIYLEVTRGSADRDFTYPPPGTPGSLVLFTQVRRLIDNPDAATGIAAVSLPDLRWARRDIKSVALLAQVLAKEEAKRRGAKEAWMHEDGVITEGGSSTAYIVTAGGGIVTRPNSRKILPGITRATLERVAAEHGLAIEERAFTLDEAYAAREAFVTAASSFVMPVVRLDERAIGAGVPGPVATRLRALYIEAARATAI